MLKYMLDTNIVIYVMKRRPIEVLNTFNRYADQMCVSSITVAELFYGAEKSQFPEKNGQAVEDFLSRLVVLPYDIKAASHFGNIKAELSKQGNIIGENDLHIAAHCRSQALVLVSNNLREFQRVDGLRLENWLN
ncbi:MAG: type II toxin-antitoxin system VapC family toxin [Pasteurellaceae bacterium]|nr:type II toxin-antitoxin system VapC family toxin [Pasteurellaceae bacterium]